MLPNRIGIDTGALYTGVLTCLVLEGQEQRLLQTGVGMTVGAALAAIVFLRETRTSRLKPLLRCCFSCISLFPSRPTTRTASTPT